MFRRNPQHQEIPKVLNYIWMGSKSLPHPGAPKNDGDSDGDGNFRTETVRKNASANYVGAEGVDRDFRAIMWLDVFTMVDDEALKAALSPDTLREYCDFQRYNPPKVGAPAPLEPPTRTVDDPKPIQPNTGMAVNNPNAPQIFEDATRILRKTRLEFSKWWERNPNRDAVFERVRCLQDMRLVCAAGKDVDGNDVPNIEIHYLDTEVYPSWLSDKTGPRYKLVNWIFFELYMRGSNYGAASDLLRVQILLDNGGMYVDHDDELVKMHDPAKLSRIGDAPKGKYTGFRYMLSFEVKSRKAEDYQEGGHKPSEMQPRLPAAATQAAEPTTVIAKPRTKDDYPVFTDEQWAKAGRRLATEAPGIVTDRAPATGFLAAPAGHPFLELYRDRMLADYDRLLARNFMWYEEYDSTKIAAVPQDVTWLLYARTPKNERKTITMGNFAVFTIEATGPGQLVRTLAAVSAKPPKGSSAYFDPELTLYSSEARVKGNFSNSWKTN